MRVRVLETVSAAGGAAANEDAAGQTGDSRRGAAWVLDGATGLVDQAFVPGAASDAAWLAGRLSAGLAALSGEALSPDSVMRGVLRGVAADYDRITGGAAVPAHALPSASGVWVRWSGGGGLEFAALGDCKALYKAEGAPARLLGGVQPFEWADARINREVQALQAAGLTDPAALFARLSGPLRGVRALMNTAGGYWIFGVAPEAADHLVSEALNGAGAATVLLVSDGFYRLVDTYGAFTEDGLVIAALGRGLAALVRELRAIEAEDPDCRRFPRLKPRDDATALLIEIRSPSSATGEYWRNPLDGNAVED